jgi:hypothetical protein
MMKAITSISFAAALGVGLALSNSAIAESFNSRGTLLADSVTSDSPTISFESSGRVALGGFNERGPKAVFVTGEPNTTPWRRESAVAWVNSGFNNRGNGVFSAVDEKSYDFDNARVVGLSSSVLSW